MNEDIRPYSIRKVTKQTPLEVQEHTLKQDLSKLEKENQEKVARYVDTFQRMLNKGKYEAMLAFTMVGIEMTKQAMKQNQEIKG